MRGILVISPVKWSYAPYFKMLEVNDNTILSCFFLSFFKSNNDYRWNSIKFRLVPIQEGHYVTIELMRSWPHALKECGWEKKGHFKNNNYSFSFFFFFGRKMGYLLNSTNTLFWRMVKKMSQTWWNTTKTYHQHLPLKTQLCRCMMYDGWWWLFWWPIRLELFSWPHHKFNIKSNKLRGE